MVLIMLDRTKLALKECQKHLIDTEASGTAIESYLTQHLLVLLSADMQQAIYGCLNRKAKQTSDQSIQQYISSTRKNIVREVTKSGIAGFVKRFGIDAKQKFDDCLKDKEQEVTRYGNAMENRDSVVHKQGVQVTFREIEQAVEAADIILSAITCALDIVDYAQASEASLDAD